MRPVLPRLVAPANLEALLPHLAELAPHLPELAPHWPVLLGRLPLLRPVLPALCAQLPALLRGEPPPLGLVLQHAEALQPDLPALLQDAPKLQARLATLEKEKAAPLAANGGGKSAGKGGDAAADGPRAGEESTIWGGLRAALSFLAQRTSPDEIARARMSRTSRDFDEGPNLARVVAAIDGAARRMNALEQEFVDLKHRTSWRQQQVTEGAVRLSMMEGALFECEEGVMTLSSDTRALGHSIKGVEDQIGQEAIARGREARRLNSASAKPLDSFLARLPL